jgi:UDP-glucose 4-epimerase
MKILITGLNGFIGEALKHYFNDLYYEVYGLERDLLNSVDVLKNKLIEIKPDYIFHLAAYGNHNNQKDVSTIFEANVIKTFNLLQACREIKLKGFINVGSSSEYGNKNERMQENLLPETKTMYGVTKVAGTYLARGFAHTYGMPVVTVRPFSVYGPGEASNRFIPTMIRGLETGYPTPLAFEPKHDWIYIDDLISGISQIALFAYELRGSVINIGTGKQYSNVEVVKVLEKISGKTLMIDIFDNLRSYDSTNWVADNSALVSLGWKQKYTLEEGLKKTYDYYK